MILVKLIFKDNSKSQTNTAHSNLVLHLILKVYCRKGKAAILQHN